MISREDSRPNPDPTVRTAEQLMREIASLKELLEKELHALKALHEEKFHSVKVQLRERDIRVKRTARDNKLALDAALEAAKEAVSKSEFNTTKQIDQMTQLIQSGNKAADDKIDDIKDRLTKIEGVGVGKETASTAQHNSSSTIISIISTLVAMVALAATIFRH